MAAGCEKTTSLQTASPGTFSKTTSEDAGKPGTAVMYVRGMGCPQCAYNVDLQQLKVPGVEDVKVDMGSGMVTAALSPNNPPTREQLASAIRQTGFTLTKIEMR